jgi:hypothetical protein
MSVTVKPTNTDLAIGRFVARHTDPQGEKAASVVTWGGDEHVLGGLAIAWWL